MRGWVSVLARIAGRRGAFLACLAGLDGVMWWALLHDAGDRELTVLVDPHIWAWIWLAVGAFCAAGVFAKRDRINFTLAVAIKTWWGLRYIQTWLVQGANYAWESAAIWLVVAAAVFLVSTWPEPTVIVDRDGDQP